LQSAPSSDQDVLSALPGLDGWLDEEEPAQNSEVQIDKPKHDEEPTEKPKTSNEDTIDDELLAQSFDELDASLDLDEDSDFDLSALELDEDFDSELSRSDDDDLIEGLDDADFDEMLNDLANDQEFAKQTDVSDTKDFSDQQTHTAKKDGDKRSLDPLEQAGLDIDALMTDDDKTEPSDAEDFLDVDDLLRDSDAMPEISDADLDLNLESSLDKLVPNRTPAPSTETSDSSDSDQASNLDLAQVYIDMEDFDAAQELLDEVIQKGSSEQQSEALSLISAIKR